MYERRQSLIVLAITALFGFIGLYGYADTHSIGLLSDVLHLIADGLPLIGALCLTIPLLLEEQEGMLEDAIKLFNRAFILASGVSLIVLGAYRFAYPRDIGGLMVVFAAIEVVGNLAQVWYAHDLKAAFKDPSAHRSLIDHLRADVYASLSVLAAGILIALTHWSWCDSLASIAGGILTLRLLMPKHQHSHAHEHGPHCHHGHH